MVQADGQPMPSLVLCETGQCHWPVRADRQTLYLSRTSRGFSFRIHGWGDIGGRGSTMNLIGRFW